ncbi:MAG: hypothetical protein ACTSYF_06895 [Promethearchaeota archaeon]
MAKTDENTSPQGKYELNQDSSQSNTQQSKREKHIALLVIGIITTIIAQCFSINNPNAYTIGGLAAVILSQPIAYSIILGILALIVAAIKQSVRRYWLTIFAWLFLVAGLFDIVVKGYTELFLKPQIDQGIQELIESGKLDVSQDSFSYENTQKKLSYSYAGISFDYLKKWKIEKKELQEDLVYQINCDKEGLNSSEIISITWLNMVMDTQEMIQNAIEGMKEEAIYKNSQVKSIISKYYKGFNAVSVDFDFVLFGKKYFGRIISFNTKGKTILILKQTDKIEKLDTEFKIIENSLKFY